MWEAGRQSKSKSRAAKTMRRQPPKGPSHFLMHKCIHETINECDSLRPASGHSGPFSSLSRRTAFGAALSTPRVLEAAALLHVLLPPAIMGLLQALGRQKMHPIWLADTDHCWWPTAPEPGCHLRNYPDQGVLFQGDVILILVLLIPLQSDASWGCRAAGRQART